MYLLLNFMVVLSLFDSKKRVSTDVFFGFLSANFLNTLSGFFDFVRFIILMILHIITHWFLRVNKVSIAKIRVAKYN
jgi:hypothetical protein